MNAGAPTTNPVSLQSQQGLKSLRENYALSPEGTAEHRSRVSVVPTGLLDGAFLTQDYVLGYFQTSLRD
jgi:hypothetical protein